MATIQIRDVPEDVYETIRRRARAEGQSIQAYMHDLVVAAARRRSKRELMAEIEQDLAVDPGPGGTVESVLAALDADRRR